MNVWPFLFYMFRHYIYFETSVSTPVGTVQSFTLTVK